VAEVHQGQHLLELTEEQVIGVFQMELVALHHLPQMELAGLLEVVAAVVVEAHSLVALVVLAAMEYLVVGLAKQEAQALVV
jgi:hypothetical protein